MKDYTYSKPSFSDTIKIPEVTDTNHADNINAPTKQLLDNDIVLKTLFDALVDKLKQVAYSGSYNDLEDKPTNFSPSSHKHTKSEITDFPSSLPASDVSTWAKAANKPSYNWNEIGNKPTSMPASDVSSWAKAANKPSYNWNEIGNKPTIPAAVAVKGNAESAYRTGNVNLTPANIGAATANHSHSSFSNLSIGDGHTVAGGAYLVVGRANSTSKWQSGTIGSECTNDGYNNLVTGYRNFATGTDSSGVFMAGENSTVTGSRGAVLGGIGNTAKNDQTVIGHHANDSLLSAPHQWGQDTTGTAFAIGNGNGSSSKSNAFRVNYNGTTYAKGNYNSTGADYAEYFEWLDSNPDDEERIGLFVTLEGEKIKLANEGDYILGIISANPSVIGNSDEHWMGQYKKDVFNRYVIKEQTETIKEIKMETLLNDDGSPVLDETGNPVVTAKEVEREITVNAYVENEGYDKDKGYVQRCDRPEWDTVGLLGQLVCYDDGTCQVNGYCKCGQNGIGTAATFEEGSLQTPVYRVMERVADNLVRVLLK